MKRVTMAAVLCALLLGATTVLAGGNDPCLPKGGTLINGKCLLSISAQVTVDYPLDLGQNEVVASAIDPFIQAARDQFFQAVGSDFSPAPGPYALDMTYEEVHHSDRIASLVFTIYEFTGGAHGNTTYQTYTFDLEHGTLLTLDDLFTSGDPLALIAPLVEADLNEQLKGMSDADWIHSGTGSNPDNYLSWALDTDALVFYFAPYQVAAYAIGPQTVRIPLSELGSILKPEFAP